MRVLLIGVLVLVWVPLAGCRIDAGGGADLTIAAATHYASLQPLIERFAERRGYRIEVAYMPSVDMMLALHDRGIPYDAVWPAHSLWIALGDDGLNRVRHVASIMRSPLVVGVRESLAEELGFVGRDVTLGEVLAAAQSGRLRLLAADPARSHSGANLLLGFLYGVLGRPDVLTGEALRDAALQANVASFASTIDELSPGSGRLKDAYLDAQGRYDGMASYEVAVIETNQELVRRRQEQLYAVYPVDGQGIADSPLGYVDKGDAERQRVFLELQEYLLSGDVQRELLDRGWRTGLLGLSATEVDARVFNPDWGIDTTRVINPVRFPVADVLFRALGMYQLAACRASFTVFALDYSESMTGAGERALEEAMTFLLDQENARRYLLSSGPDDVTVVIPFHVRPVDDWVVEGNRQEDLNGLLTRIVRQRPGGDSDIYLPLIRGLEVVAEHVQGPDAYQTSIVLMTDGRSNSDHNMRRLRQAYEQGNREVPVVTVLFGDAQVGQVQAIAELTQGRVFDGTTQLVQALRSARGYR